MMKNVHTNGKVHHPRPNGSAPDALAVERGEAGTAVLALTGELDLYDAPRIEGALGKLIGAEPADGVRPLDDVQCIMVDLRSVTFLDSTILGVLLAASRRQQSRNGELVVVVGPDTPMTAFEVTGFDRLLEVMRVDHDSTVSAA